MYSSDLKFQTITCHNNYTDISCNNNKGIFWSADANTDLTSFKLDGTTPVLQQSNIKSSGIGTTAPFHMAFCNNQLYVAGGGKALDRKGYRGVVSKFSLKRRANVKRDENPASKAKLSIVIKGFSISCCLAYSMRK